MNIQDLRSSIAQKYSEHCEKIHHQPNKALIRELVNPSHNAPPNDEQGGNTSLDIIFRGNDKLNFSSRLRDKDLIILCETLQESGEIIRHIDLSYNLITDTGAESLAQLIGNCPYLESLNLQGNDIETAGSQELANHLKENFSLRYLNLESNKIRTNGAMNIIEILFTNKNLIELNLGDNDITHDGMIGITSVLNYQNNTLAVLNVDRPTYTSIGQETAIHFAKMLQSNRSVEKLSLQKHAFNCEAIYTITEHLLENNKLRVLDLTANKISFKGCEALAKYLCSEYCALESLILASNRTGHYGAKVIAQALSKTRSLVHLDMTRNDIDDNGLKMIAESLETNDSLISLKLYWNHFGQMALQEFHKLRTRPRKENWYWDFHTYIVDSHIEMAYIETRVPYDVTVSLKYYVE
ncbi:hypothetical protein TTHERM_00695730 (macronuclear) [Tetrahymena thermophila SB210]|uniref:Kinase domain protein n=1 Tax=Tetrahymena thermophila (strain SB210) TaxID=312017 RepID=Q24C99_TETTS|nr:hypothetical protein TTHERM_00695730 [Tetrahymena thermophila SB210]EAS05339.1 hypothetical protein TTHERM_00695730 [Tetrahymena thermophila SB210]|eukprot:XP_001025584.1 hypothetical protein TTHERM_00695730 [Tetrahymena thermophila SB210]